MTRWSTVQAQAWWAATPWICGVNFLPSSAVNFLEMWRADTFDPATIERELGWAAGIGVNAIRTNLGFAVWAHDRDGLIERFDRVLAMAARAGIRTVPCLFDDCGFGGAEPVWGPQPAPVAGVHNSRAVASPGRAAVMDRTLWPRFEAYLRDLVATFGRDDRILFWDLYNEPGNRMIFSAAGFHEHDAALAAHSRALMEASFGWARALAPAQPLTVAAWSVPDAGAAAPPFDTEIDRSALDLSDILSFHAYADPHRIAAIIARLRATGRPVFCTEWMARALGSRIANTLPLFRAAGVGSFQWGFVNGRTQTHLPWPEALVRAHGGQITPGPWFHDLLHKDGRPYDPAEIETIRALTGIG